MSDLAHACRGGAADAPGADDRDAAVQVGQPAQLLADDQAIGRFDSVLAESVARPRVSIVAATRSHFAGEFPDYLTRCRIKQVLNTYVVDPQTARLTDIALWRADRS